MAVSSSKLDSAPELCSVVRMLRLTPSDDSYLREQAAREGIKVSPYIRALVQADRQNGNGRS